MREGFSIGPLVVHYYGVIIMLGVLAATWLSGRQARAAGEDPENAWDLMPWALIGGIIGARIWHILTPPASMVEQGLTTQYYLTHPLDMLAVWKGGLGIPGAVVGGAIGVYLFARSKKISFANWADFVAPGLALAQAIGRWGNFVNQELYGAPTDLPWKLFIDANHRLPGFESVEYYHPLFLYESIWNLLNMALLLYIGKRFKEWLKPLDIFLVYLMVYCTGRFGLEFLRLDPSNVLALNVNQTLMLSTVIVSAIVFIWRHRKTANQS